MEPDSEPKEVQPVVIKQRFILRLKRSIAAGIDLWDGITHGVKGLVAPFANLPVVIALILILVLASVAGSLISYRQFANLITGQSEKIDTQVKKIRGLEKENARLLESEERYKRNSIEARKKVLETEQELERTVAASRKKLVANGSSGQAACPEARKGTAYPEYVGSPQDVTKPPVICNIDANNTDKKMEQCIDELKRSKAGKSKPASH